MRYSSFGRHPCLPSLFVMLGQRDEARSYTSAFAAARAVKSGVEFDYRVQRSLRISPSTAVNPPHANSNEGSEILLLSATHVFGKSVHELFDVLARGFVANLTFSIDHTRHA
jgi:hypothetical protein